MKKSLETRKGNVLSINDLLKDFKAEGELTSGNFPQTVGEKIAQLNVDWQIIIRLALALKEQPVDEEVLIAQSVPDRHEAPISFDSLHAGVEDDTFSLSKDIVLESSSMDFNLDCKSQYTPIYYSKTPCRSQYTPIYSKTPYPIYIVAGQIWT